MIDLCVVSHACFTAINRNVYHLFLRDGWRVNIVIPKTLQFASGEKMAELPQAGDPPLHYLDLIGSNPRTYHFKGLIELLNRERPRIILLDNDPVSRMTIQLGRWAKKNNAWLFCISNENLSLDISSAVRRRGWKALPAAMVKRTMLYQSKQLVDGVFTINRDGQQIFLQEGYPQVRVMPLGFDPAYFFPDPKSGARIREKLNLKRKVIAYFGRLTREKGIHLLIQALGKLKQYDWQLMMDSFDPYSSPYHGEVNELLQRENIADRVVFINPSHTEIAAYMNAADFVVVPSITVPDWKEQYGRVAAEAMACGKTVIASDSGALPDLLGGHGYLFKEGDANALKDILDKLLSGAGSDGLPASEISGYALDRLSIEKQKKVMEEAFGNLGMKVLLVGSQFEYGIERYYIKYLRQAGVEIIHFPAPDIVFRERSKSLLNKVLFKAGLRTHYAEVNKELVQLAEEQHPDIIWIFKGMEIYPSTLKQLRPQFKLANYNPDHPFIISGAGSGNKNVTDAVPLYHLHFCYNHLLQQQIGERYGIRTAFLPFGFELPVEEFAEAEHEPEINKVCFVGNPGRIRIDYIALLAKAGVEIDLYGHGWNRTALRNTPNVSIHDAVYGLAFWKRLRQYRVQINIFRKHNIGSHNMRTFEIPAVGGIQLAPYNEEQTAFFHEGKEIFFYRGENDLVRSAKDILLSSTEDINQCRHAARQRSLASGYSYRDRTSIVLENFEKLIG